MAFQGSSPASDLRRTRLRRRVVRAPTWAPSRCRHRSSKSARVSSSMSALSTCWSSLTSSSPQMARCPVAMLISSAGRSAALVRPSQLASPRAGPGLGVGLAVAAGVGTALGEDLGVRLGVPADTVGEGVEGRVTVTVVLGVGVLDGVGVALTGGCPVAAVDGVAVGAPDTAGTQNPPFTTNAPPSSRPAAAWPMVPSSGSAPSVRNVAPPPAIANDGIAYGPPPWATAGRNSAVDSNSAPTHSSRVPHAPRNVRLPWDGASPQF